MFSLEERKRFIEETFKNEPKVTVITYEGLTIDLCHKIKADFILRGLRNPADFEFEKAIAHTKQKIVQNRNGLFIDRSTNFLYQL